MKAYRYFPSMLCLIGVCLSQNRASGAVQINPNPEKQPAVVMIQYLKDWTYSSVELSESPISDDETENIKWDEGKPGSWANDACWGSVIGDDYYYDSNRAEWGADGVGTIAGDIHRGHKGDVCGVRNGTPSSYTAPTSWPGEFCADKTYRRTALDGFAELEESVTRKACTLYELRTGGKKGSKLKNLFRLAVSATEYRNLFYPEIDSYSESCPVDPRVITVPGASWLDDNGVTYGKYADNTIVDITPKANCSYYSIGISATKYKSSFTIYAKMPDPDGCTMLNLTDAGHAWWRFRTEAPADGISRFMGANFSQYIGLPAGYYPDGFSPLFIIGTFPGAVECPESHDGDDNASKSYEIGFDDLISGISYTKKLKENPGYWNAAVHNCVHAATGAAKAAGVSFPTCMFPEEVGHIIKYGLFGAPCL